MITTGIDLVSVERIKNSIDKNPRFMTRVFGVEEINLFREKNSIQTIAGNFAVKEAFSKAISTGIRGFKLTEVQTLRDSLGAPYLVLSGNAEKIAQEKNLKFSVSISHTEEYATAIVIGYHTNLC